MTAREVLLAWAKSPGFAAIHNGLATDEQIVEDLLAWLDRHEFPIEARNSDVDWLSGHGRYDLANRNQH